jgi:hypothetical protein
VSAPRTTLTPAVGSNALSKLEFCFAPERVLSQRGTSLFGLFCSEPSIFSDYLFTTNGSIFRLPGLPAEPDWWDSAGIAAELRSDLPKDDPRRKEVDPRENYIDLLVRRHGVAKEKLERIRDLQWPDISTFMGLRERSLLMRDRHEFDEIKPDSDTGLRDGRDKVKALVDFHAKSRTLLGRSLPYRPGVVYPSGGSTTIPLLNLNRQFLSLARMFLKNAAIESVMLYIKVRRHEPGLLLYKLCIRIPKAIRREKAAVAAVAAKSLYAAYVVSVAPTRFMSQHVPDLAQEIWGDPSRVIPIPKIQVRFDVIGELDAEPVKRALETAMYSRALVVPGEEYMVCCDEAFFQQQILTRVPVARALQAIRVPPSAWPVGGVGGLAIWGASQPVVQPALWLAATVKDLFPASVEFVDAVMSFASDHPYLTMGIVVVGLVVTAGVAAYLVPELIGTAVILEAGGTVAADVAAADGLGAVAMTEPVVAQATNIPVATASAARGAQTVTQLTTQLSTGQSAGNVVSLAKVLAQREAAKQAAAKAVTGVSAAAAFTLIMSSKTAFASEPDKAAAEGIANAQVVAMDFAKLFIVPTPKALRAGVKFPQKYDAFDLLDFAVPDLSGTSGLAIPGVKKTVNARYLGKLSVSGVI